MIFLSFPVKWFQIGQLIIIVNMQQSTRIFITGTNRGLGKSLVELLHKSHPEVQIHISSRGDPSALSQQWSAELPGSHFSTYQIDLNDSQSIANSVQLLKSQHITFDYIVANAALGCDYGTTIPSFELAKNTLHTNVNSTIDFVKQFLPLLTPQGRVVLVSSFMGALEVQSEQFRNRLNNPAITEQEILGIAEEYIKCAKAKEMGSFHWSAYRTSKALLNSWSRFVLPKYLKEGQSSIALHPGWCQTDMGGKAAALTAEQGAQRISNGIWLKETDPSKFYNDKWCDYHACQ